MGFSNEIEVFVARARQDNAFSTIARGRRILVADVGFLQRVNLQTHSEWTAIEVIAHEVGHHIAGFGDDPHTCELNADYWSGQTLQRLGASRQAATAAILAIGNDEDSESHPNKFRRSELVGAGWDDASKDLVDFTHCGRCQG